MSTARTIGRLFAVLIAFGFIIGLPALLLGYNAVSAATSRGFMNAAVAETKLFDGVISQAAQELSRTVPTDRRTRHLPIARLTESDWESILLVAAPPESLQRWVKDALDRFDPWAWRGGSFFEETVIPFGEMRDNLVNDPDLVLLRTLAAAQPSCAPGQDPMGALGVLPVCLPDELKREEVIQAAGAILRATPDAVWRELLPESVGRYTRDMTLAELIEQQSGKRWEEVRAGWRWAGWSLGLGRVLLALLIAAGAVITLGAIALLAARKVPEAMRWIGAPVFLAGVIALAWGVAIWLGATNWAEWHPAYAGVTVKMEAALESLAYTFGRRWFVPMLWQGAVLAVLGLVVWCTSYLLPKPRPKE